MARLSNGWIAVGNYGNKHIEDLRSYSSLNPTIAFFEEKTLKHRFTVPAPRLGSISHLCEGWEGELIAIPAKLATLNQQAVELVTHASHGKKPMVTLAELAEGKIGFPSPVLTLNLESKKWSSILPEIEKHRRPQSIAFDKKTKSLWVSFSYSESILKIDEKRNCHYISAFDLGMEIPRGVCIGPDNLVYICGQSRVLVALNPKDMSLVNRYDTKNYNSTHVLPV
jgi:hypothetical protein